MDEQVMGMLANYLSQQSAGNSTRGIELAIKELADAFRGKFELTTYTNPGSAGGTFRYGNIGPLKLFFGATVNNIGATAPAGYILTWPVGFWSAAPAVSLTTGPNNTTNQQNITIGGGGLTTVQVSMNLWASSTTVAEAIQVIALGV